MLYARDVPVVKRLHDEKPEQERYESQYEWAPDDVCLLAFDGKREAKSEGQCQKCSHEAEEPAPCLRITGNQSFLLVGFVDGVRFRGLKVNDLLALCTGEPFRLAVSDNETNLGSALGAREDLHFRFGLQFLLL